MFVRTARSVAASILTACVVALSPGAADAAPRIAAISGGQGDRIVIRGNGFGNACARCEVIAQYERGPRTALLVDDWSDDAIAARLPDLNAGDSARLQVVTGQGTSAPSVARIPPKFAERTAGRHESQRKVGDKGELSVPVSQPAPQCARPSPVFEDAKVRYRKRRFGAAEIVSKPRPGCTDCAPVVVRWYHEPTGALDFEVVATWRIVEGLCPARKR